MVDATEPRSARPAATSGVGAQVVAWVQLVVLTIAVPIVVLQVMTGAGYSTVVALLVGSIGPLLDIAITFVVRRRLDELAAVVLVFIVLGIVVTLIFDDPRLFLLKESATTGVLGLMALGSLVLAPRPLMFYFGRRFATGGDPARVAWWNGLWRYPGFRRMEMVITAVWGAAFLTEAVVRGILTYVLPVDVMVVLNTVVPLVVVVALMAWTTVYAKRRQRVAEQHGISVEPPPPGTAPA